MKVQERAGAPSHRGPGQAAPVGERLPTAGRERKPALAALAVLLILIGALGATVLVLRAGERIEVVRISAEVPAGKAVTDAAMTSVLVADDPAVDYVRWEQRDALKQLKAKNTLVKGTIAIGQMFSDVGGLPEGKAFVGLSLKAGQYPAGLKVGDHVAAYRVGGDAPKGGTAGGAADGNTLLVRDAKVNDVFVGEGGSIGSGNLPVTVMVGTAEIAPLTQAAAAGQVALVLIPGASG
ncbi:MULTISPECIES: hypothetical protein [unclassified Streptomyces]|uniref:hypothetical protein n=1 Tax=unclassified Streptomyces TaxID=2593676 RepID=UPI000DC754AD|nr:MULTISPECIES: hypothetical protein [unclassified Streptomyces]AWZ08535.1 hypothetical protein DRB89_32565 [Streptomyces sp. ICC4]AWZ15016.1 hypothetical protein DRB96_25250 [Streptomyces sp. ICC1]